MLNHSSRRPFPGTKTMRFSRNAEARLGIDGVWRMWERVHWTHKHDYSGHVDLETPGEVWMCTNTANSPTKLVVTEGAAWKIRKANQTILSP